MKQFYKGCAAAIAAGALMCGVATTASAAVTLNADGAYTKVAAERTKKIGDSNDGKIALVPSGTILWTAGCEYVSGNIISMGMDKDTGIKLNGNWTFDDAPGAWAAAENILNVSGYTLSLQVPAAGVPAAQKMTITYASSDNLKIVDMPVTDNIAATGAYSIYGSMKSSGGIALDSQGSDVILATAKQFSAGTPTNTTSTIDAIDAQALEFLAANTTVYVGGDTFNGAVSGRGEFVLTSSGAFGVSASNTPDFSGSDTFSFDLVGDLSFIEKVFITGAAADANGKIYDVSAAEAAAGSKTITLSVTEMTAINTNCPGGGAGAADSLPIEVRLLGDGTNDLLPGSYRANNLTLNLATTGNGTISVGNAGTILTFAINGTTFRANHFRVADSQWFKFSNSGTVDAPIDVRYHSADGATSSSWTEFAVSGTATPIPADGEISITDDQINALLAEVTGTSNGWLEFRVHAGSDKVTAVEFGKSGESFFNMPMQVLTTNLDSNGTDNTVWR